MPYCHCEIYVTVPFLPGKSLGETFKKIVFMIFKVKVVFSFEEGY